VGVYITNLVHDIEHGLLMRILPHRNGGLRNHGLSYPWHIQRLHQFLLLILVGLRRCPTAVENYVY